MAAKLKKRALAEYSEVQEVPQQQQQQAECPKPLKRLRLVLCRQVKDESSSGAGSTADPALQEAHRVLQGGSSGDSSEVSRCLVLLLSRFSSLSVSELVRLAVRILAAATDRVDLDTDVRVQAFRALQLLLQRLKSILDTSSSPEDEEEELEALKTALRTHVEQWAKEASLGVANKGGNTLKTLAPAVFALVAALPDLGVPLPLESHWSLLSAAEALLQGTGSASTATQIGALKVLGDCLVVSGSAEIQSRALALAGKTTESPEPRVRAQAFDTLLALQSHGVRLDVSLYSSFCSALTDDFVGVRMAALRLVHVVALQNPEEKVLLKKANPDSSVRMVDDAFGKICNAINDLELNVRELSAELIGAFAASTVSQEFLEQTLDKKLMSNMRAKRSAHQRQSKLVSSGEWSSGQKWADDAPKEAIEANDIHLMTFGACGAFIHGLEDEFLAVRSVSVEALTKLSTGNPRLAALALDFLVDMFNDEIELVRLKAIESLTIIAGHISLQVHQLETILSALDDYSLVVREKLHLMLQASTIATKDGLQNVISKLMENLKKYPGDKRSILLTFKHLGESHSELTLPLVTQLLEIHPFFDTPEPDIEDAGYLCILVLVFNAARSCPTMEPLLDQHTKRHFLYLVDTYPHLMPSLGQIKSSGSLTTTSSSARFLQQTLRRVSDSEHLSMSNRLQLLERSVADLQRLGSLEPTVSGATHFAESYLRAQAIAIKCLQTRFWCGGHARSGQGSQVLDRQLSEAWRLCTQMKFLYTNVGEREQKLVALLHLQLLCLQLLYIVRVSNKSALPVTEQFLAEMSALLSDPQAEQRLSQSAFLTTLVKKLSETDDYKPGTLARLVQPLLVAHHIESLPSSFGIPQGPKSKNIISRCYAVIFEPVGMNEAPLKYTAGMVLAVPVDCEIYFLRDPSQVRLAIKTPDQCVQLITPKQGHFFAKDPVKGHYRLLTDALMSQQQVWSEALHVEIRFEIGLD